MIPPHDPSALATAMIRVLVAVWGADALDPDRRQQLARSVSAYTGVDTDVLELLLDDARRMRPVALATATEQRVFASHFGERAASLLDAGVDTQPLVETFADFFGLNAAISLLQLLLEVPAGAGEREERVVAALEGLGVDRLLIAALRNGAPGAGAAPVEIAGKQALIGSSPSCEIVLPDPRVEPIHAELVRAGGVWRVVARGERATVLDGAAVASSPITDGSVLQIGPYRLRLRGRAVSVEPASAPFALEARGIRRATADRVLLDGVNFTALAGEVIALVGPSGAGKSTLVGALSGAAPADEGEILLGGVPIEAALAEAPTLAGEVPQDDIVLPELSVEESLQFAARIRLPVNVSAEDRQAAVNRVLVELGLESIRGHRIGDPERKGVSGGQRKRVNLGQEIVSDATRVIFLDEPTSGLDPKAATEIARLARRLADAGRIVILVTHDMSASVMAQCDHLLVMVGGGRVAWFGPVAEAVENFGASTPAQIFERLGTHRPEHWAARYAASTAAFRWSTMRSEVVRRGLLPRPERERAPAVRPGRLPLLRTLMERYLLVKRRDEAGWLVLMLQPLLLAVVMHLVFPRPTASLIFLLTLSALWFGMSAAVRELISDRPIWLRERRVGVGVTAWLGSKILVLGGLVALQCAALTALVFPYSGLGPHGFSPTELIVATTLAGWSGVATGLLVSAFWGRSEAAVGTIVLLLVPEIAFSGVMMPLTELGLVARAISWFNPARYAFHLVLRSGDTLEYIRLTDWYSRPVSGELYLMGLRPEGEGAMGLGAPALVLILGVMMGAQLLGAAYRLRRLPRKRRSRNINPTSPTPGAPPEDPLAQPHAAGVVLPSSVPVSPVSPVSAVSPGAAVSLGGTPVVSSYENR